jgi:Flp pilus assembly protein TadD/ketosteroid isomerase-like protein
MHISAAARLSLAGIAIAFVLAATAAAADELAEASQLLRSGQREQAMERVDKILAKKPGDPQARFLKGLIYTEQGNAHAAIEVFQKLTQDYPELPEPFNNLAVVYASQGQYDKARVALERSIRTHPSYATAYENLGDVYAKLASQAYDKALKLDSGNTGAQNKLALVRDLVGAPPREAPSSIAAAAAPEAPAARPEAPAAKPPTPAAKPEAEPQDVLAAVAAWAAAWSRRDVDAYLAAYAKDFRPPHGQSRSDWEKLRRERVSAPKSISVKIDVAKVRDRGDGKVSVTFQQDYRSDRFRSSSTKTLLMDKSEDGHWRILQEQVSD